MAVGGLDVAVPEVVAETEAARQVEDDLRVGAGLAAGRDHRPSQLDERLRLRARLEADLERLPLEGGGDGQDDVGQLGGGVHEEVGVDIEVERRQRRATTEAVRVGEEEIGAEADQAAHGVGLPLQNGAVDLIAW